MKDVPQHLSLDEAAEWVAKLPIPANDEAASMAQMASIQKLRQAAALVHKPISEIKEEMNLLSEITNTPDMSTVLDPYRIALKYCEAREAEKAAARTRTLEQSVAKKRMMVKTALYITWPVWGLPHAVIEGVIQAITERTILPSSPARSTPQVIEEWSRKIIKNPVKKA